MEWCRCQPTPNDDLVKRQADDILKVVQGVIVPTKKESTTLKPSPENGFSKMIATIRISFSSSSLSEVVTTKGLDCIFPFKLKVMNIMKLNIFKSVNNNNLRIATLNTTIALMTDCQISIASRTVPHQLTPKGEQLTWTFAKNKVTCERKCLYFHLPCVV